MPIMHSFLESVFLFVKSLAAKVTKQMYRSASVIITGVMVVTVISFSANGFGGSGRNAIAAPMIQDDSEEEADSREALAEDGFRNSTEAKIIGLTDTGSVGQQLAGELLVQSVRQKQQEKIAAQAEIEALKKEILKQQQEEQARKEAQEAKRKAEEAKRAAEEKRKAARRIRYTDEDYQVLLRIVEAEAGICDEKGKILVADVIINRVLSDEFPNSVTAVVYDPSQFQPVSNGTINSVKVTAETIDSVNRALDGEDYSNGALYFMNRKGSGSAASWFDRHLDYLFSHDGHEFFK